MALTRLGACFNAGWLRASLGCEVSTGCVSGTAGGFSRGSTKGIRATPLSPATAIQPNQWDARLTMPLVRFDLPARAVTSQPQDVQKTAVSGQSNWQSRQSIG